jgi:hypothetical protein
MRAITIDAKSFESAQGIYSALSDFRPELSGSDAQGYRVSVELRAGWQVVNILAVLEGYVTRRHDGPARIELDGRRYTLEATHN